MIFPYFVLLVIEEVCAGEGLNNIKSQLQVRRWLYFIYLNNIN